MTIVQDDKCDAVPRIDGTEVTVIDVYHMAVRQGQDPAKVAHEFDIGVARVHEAIAYYYDHASRMRELEDWDDLAPASADREVSETEDGDTETNPFDNIIGKSTSSNRKGGGSFDDLDPDEG